MAAYSIRAVALKTGVNAATLRTWERRYAAVAPERQPNGSRAYSDAAVRRVHLLKQATEAGHAIRNIAPLADELLEKLVQDAAPAVAASATEATVEQLLSKVDEMDLAGIERLIATAALSFAPPVLVELVLGPMMKEVGERWHRGALSVAQEHAISASVSSALQAIIRTYPAPTGGSPVILATLPGERHELALMMVRFVLASQGVPTHYLGVDLPVEDIARTATELASQVIAISAINGNGTLEHYKGELNQLLEKTPTAMQLWVGGAQRNALTSALQTPRVHCVNDMSDLEKRAWMMRN